MGIGKPQGSMRGWGMEERRAAEKEQHSNPGQMGGLILAVNLIASARHSREEFLGAVQII